MLIGDEVAELLVEYAALIGRLGSADHVPLHVLNAQGEAVVVDVLLNSGTVLLVESTNSPFEEPDDAGTLELLRARAAALDTRAGPGGEDPLRSAG
jgi:hypothetical protein